MNVVTLELDKYIPHTQAPVIRESEGPKIKLYVVTLGPTSIEPITVKQQLVVEEERGETKVVEPVVEQITTKEVSSQSLSIIREILLIILHIIIKRKNW